MLAATVMPSRAAGFPHDGQDQRHCSATCARLLGGRVDRHGQHDRIRCVPAAAAALLCYLDAFLPSLVRTPAAAALLAIATSWIVVGVNVAGVALADHAQIVTAALGLLPLVEGR
jgi:hypothetical protein